MVARWSLNPIQEAWRFGPKPKAWGNSWATARPLEQHILGLETHSPLRFHVEARYSRIIARFFPRNSIFRLERPHNLDVTSLPAE